MIMGCADAINKIKQGGDDRKSPPKSRPLALPLGRALPSIALALLHY